MAYAVYLVGDNGTRDLAKKFEQLSDAARYAFGVADDVENHARGDRANPPRKVDVYCGDRLEISVFVTRDGLLGNKAHPKLRSM